MTVEYFWRCDIIGRCVKRQNWNFMGNGTTNRIRVTNEKIHDSYSWRKHIIIATCQQRAKKKSVK